MFRLSKTLLRSVLSALKSRRDLVLENLVLRQQLSVLESKTGRPKLSNTDRAFWVATAGKGGRPERPAAGKGGGKGGNRRKGWQPTVWEKLVNEQQIRGKVLRRTIGTSKSRFQDRGEQKNTRFEAIGVLVCWQRGHTTPCFPMGEGEVRFRVVALGFPIRC